MKNWKQLELNLQKLKDNGINFNMENSYFGQIEMEYLCFWVTQTGIRPINMKVEAIVNMMPPNNTKYVCAFIVIVKY